ncbi:OmpA family protein [Photobacterium atrarenae]|uniref:OmpA family protein n=1 Tax=Photobacterium atrarenae TaxID=865757 RepID=A0ABY5GNU1_9GAMM|nr:OmpA family protein [Photobacterium atrarenae]UTV30222.1 OmpA family protein [Photobacterium atrarenae]
MTKKFKILPLVLLVSGAVNAATDHPWYAGARVGGTNYDNFDKALDGAESNFDRDDWGGGVFIGFQQNDWFSVEGGYTYLGQADVKNGSGGVEVQGVDFVGKFTWAASPVVDLYGKLGGFIFDVDNSVLDKDDKGVAATAGIGAEYYFNDSLSTRLEYQYYHQLGDTAPGETDIHFYGVSLVYHWGAAAPVPVIEPEPMSEPEPMPEPTPTVTKVPAISVNLPFAFDSKSISPEDIALMKPIATRLTEYPDSKLYVVGHTDARGTDAYNLKLSEERAAAVAQYLKGHFGLTQDRIVVMGKGESEPIAPNDTAAGQAKNRRVEVYTPGFELRN